MQKNRGKQSPGGWYGEVGREEGSGWGACDFFLKNIKKKKKNNRMEKTRDLFKKIRDTRGTFHAKIDSIKDRNGMDLTEAKDIKRRWQEYTEEVYKRS